MALTTPPPDSGSDYSLRQFRGAPRRLRLLGLLLLVPLILVIGFGYVWYVQRIEVDAGEMLVLIRKVGAPLPSHDKDGNALPDSMRTQVVLYPELLASLGEPPDSTKYKGIIYEAQPEGRYFYDPFFWEPKKYPAIVINKDEVGIQVRRFGDPLPPGKIVATNPGERGPLADVLMPARYNINLHAYGVERVPPIRVPPGFVGVQVLLHGDDPQNPNDWVVQPGERGVQPDVLPPGLYYNNPYVRRIEPIDVRSHTLDLRAEDAIRFPSSDSFQIVIEATVEYAISHDKAPLVMVKFGDHRDIEEKLILPYARSLSRIEGSKLLAREFISGESREAFQNAFFEGLRGQCAAQGIEIRATPIRQIEPPAEIANPISDRQVAEQQVLQFRNEIKVANSQALLVEQEEMRSQNQEIGQANREVVSIVKDAEQRKAVALTEANKRHEVAKLQLEAAREQAAAILSRGTAEAEIITLNYQAEAEPLRDAVAAFGTGDAYAQYFFYQKLAPAMKSVLASTDGPFAEIFRALSEARASNAATPSAVSDTAVKGGAQ